MIKPISAVVVATLLLNGCTFIVWGMNDPFSETTSYPLVGEDSIQSFGMVKENTAQLAKNSLVMMGKQYWFVVNPDDSLKLQAVLNADLDKQFQMVEQNPRYTYRALPVTLKSKESKAFTSDFCLRYDTEKAAEAAKLEALSFKKTSSDNKSFYLRCMTAEGRYYQAPQSLKADYRFKQSVQVEIRYKVTTKHTDAGKLIENIGATPLALAGDAVLAVVALPLAAFGKVADSLRK